MIDNLASTCLARERTRVGGEGTQADSAQVGGQGGLKLENLRFEALQVLGSKADSVPVLLAALAQPEATIYGYDC